MSWSTSELRVRLAPLNRLKPSSKIFYWPFQGGTSFVDILCFCSVLCLLCLCAPLFICALWSPAGKGLTSWLWFVVSYCEFVTFPLVSWVRCGTWLYRFLIFAPLLTYIYYFFQVIVVKCFRYGHRLSFLVRFWKLLVEKTHVSVYQSSSNFYHVYHLRSDRFCEGTKFTDACLIHVLDHHDETLQRQGCHWISISNSLTFLRLLTIFQTFLKAISIHR